MEPRTPTNEQLARAVLAFIHECGVLKNTRRTGWQWRGISACESLADHAWRVTLLAMVLVDLLQENGQNLDTEKALRMAILHEVCEVRIGDIPFPALQYLGRERKTEAEIAAVREMTAGLGPVGQRYGELFAAFEAGDGLEAQVVRAADKLEMLLQAWEYELCGHRGLQDFFDNRLTFGAIEVNELLEAIARRLQELRQKTTAADSLRWNGDAEPDTAVL